MPSATKLPLAGQVALVTGGGRGIGRAIALALADAGAAIALLARSRTELDAGEERVLQLDGSVSPSELQACAIDWLRGKDASAASG